MRGKKDMAEAEIRKIIDKALEAKWDYANIKREVKITDGSIDLEGNLVFRKPYYKADYVLYVRENYPIAIIEAKIPAAAIKTGKNAP